MLKIDYCKKAYPLERRMNRKNYWGEGVKVSGLDGPLGV